MGCGADDRAWGWVHLRDNGRGARNRPNRSMTFFIKEVMSMILSYGDIFQEDAKKGAN